jgi:hypothetical protein
MFTGQPAQKKGLHLIDKGADASIFKTNRQNMPY